MNFSGKKLLLIGFIVILIIGIPITLYLLQQQQEVRTQAEKSTLLNFTPVSSQESPIQKRIGDEIPLDIMVEPGTNLVSFVKLQILYDSDKLATKSSDAFMPNTLVFPTVMEGPVYTPGKIEITMSVGSDPTKAIQSLAKAGTVTFTALADTPIDQPTLITYGQTTQVLSIGSGDQASENVLSSTEPAVIAIGASTVTPTITLPANTITPTLTPTETPEPTEISGNTPTPTPPLTPTATPILSPTPTGTGSASNNQAPICNALAVDRATTGIAPYAITFTVNGNDNDGTISMVNFNFGDGAVSGDITTSGGIGTSSINVSISHEYPNEGTYTASAVLTDNSGDSSSATSCEQTIIVQTGATATPGGPTTPTSTFTPTPTMAETGVFDSALGIGAIALFFMIGGSLLFFML